MNTELTIHEVAEQTGFSTHTLRYYERAGLLISPVTRAESGHRRYGPDDVEWLGFLKCLRSTGMPIREMKRFAELVRQGEHTHRARRALLEAHRARILRNMQELQDNLAAVEWKINFYKEKETVLEAPSPREVPAAMD